MSGNINENDYVSLVRIPRKWFHLFVWSFSTITVVNTLVELLTDWAWEELGTISLTRMSVLMTLTVGWFFILSHVWEVIMLGYAKIFKEKVYAEGKAEAYREISHKLEAWEKRRKETEARGEIFNEPLPIPKLQEVIKPADTKK